MTEEEKAAIAAAEAKKIAEAAAEATRIAANVKAAEEAAEAATKKAAEDAAALAKAANASGDADMINKIVKEKLDAELAGIKKSLNAAYAERDEQAAKVAEFEKKEREANLKRLAEEGKHKEAFDIQLAEERAANAALAKRNIELSRDVAVREGVRGLSFRNANAERLAVKEITDSLVQNDQKEWVHRSGISIRDYCEAFAKDEEQSFLFKAKPNSGNGTTATSSGNGNVNTVEKPKSLFELTQDEVIKMAAEGKLPVSRKR